MTRQARRRRVGYGVVGLRRVGHGAAGQARREMERPHLVRQARTGLIWKDKARCGRQGSVWFEPERSGEIWQATKE